MEKKLKYMDICEDLRSRILEVKIKPGDKLPSENELSAHGRGTFCSELMRHRKQSKNIAVITTYLSDYIFPRVIQGIDWVLTDNGYSILLKNTKNSRSMEAKCLEELFLFDSHLFYKASTSFSHSWASASLGIRQSPRGLRLTLPTLGPSGIQLRLNCWAKKR